MNSQQDRAFARSLLTVGALAVFAALPFGAARAADPLYVMKITSPTINDVPDTYARYFAAAVEKASGGRIKGEVYPASQLGSIPRQIEGTQFGAIQMAVMPPEFFVGIDERFEVLAAPGLVNSIEQGQKLTADPAVRKMYLSFGAEKGLHGVGLFMSEPSDVLAKNPIRRLADFKGKKLRTFASQFQTETFSRLGATAVVMTLGDVLPALQQGTIDGSAAGMGPFTKMHFSDVAKSVTMTNQPSIFVVAEINKKWYDALPPDLQKIIDDEGAAQSVAINPTALDMRQKAEAAWAAAGGEFIKLPPDEQESMMKTMSSVGADVSKSKPQLTDAYKLVSDTAERLRAGM